MGVFYAALCARLVVLGFPTIGATAVSRRVRFLIAAIPVARRAAPTPSPARPAGAPMPRLNAAFAKIDPPAAITASAAIARKAS